MTWILPPLDVLPPAPEAQALAGDLTRALDPKREVALAEVIDRAQAPLTAAIGCATDGEPITLELSKLPHLAIAGASGSGKSTLIHAILGSLLMAANPDQLQLVLVDVTGELAEYQGLPHLVVDPIDDVEQGIQALEGLGGELERRYALLQRNHARDIWDYNRTMPEGRLPWVLCVVDEFASLMLGDEGKRVEAAVARLGIRGRKCGIHLILATQIPHAVVLTAKIKANMTGRIALAMPSAVFSRVAVDQAGAEKLHGRGDALLRDGQSVALKRFQSAYVAPETLREIVRYWTVQSADPVPVEDPHRRVIEPPKPPLPAGFERVRFTPIPRPPTVHRRMIAEASR